MNQLDYERTESTLISQTIMFCEQADANDSTIHTSNSEPTVYLTCRIARFETEIAMHSHSVGEEGTYYQSVYTVVNLFMCKQCKHKYCTVIRLNCNDHLNISL